MRNVKIRTKLDTSFGMDGFYLGGWYQGEQTYLWFGTDEKGYGTLYGPALYRLAKAVVRQFEVDRAFKSKERKSKSANNRKPTLKRSAVR